MGVRVIHSHSQTGFSQLSSDLMSLVRKQNWIVGALLDRNDYELNFCNLRRQDQALVVRVDHNHGTN
jgi:hypothetical protein